ncbi:hypothetical protein AAFC00_000452 [Neodothiora populina]|uniref:DUF7707 domain-containing protein n=1 Tax=Neodothiora populina TaxID=2781224 RepID=A0ABR3PE45_9PEZI
MHSYATWAIAMMATLVASQNNTAGTYYISPDSVSSDTRDSWCSSQQAACPLICLQTAAASSDTDANTCDPDTLTYSCVCSNGIAPNASEFSQTLPYFICTEWGNQCVTGCGSDSSCASDCRANHPCGAQNPTRVNTTTSSTMSKTATNAPAGQTTNSAGQTIFTGLGGSAATSTAAGSSGQSGATALEIGQAYGLMVVAAGLFGGFALLL